MNPLYPLYIVSKGRWHENRRLTVRTLEHMRIPYRIVVEEQEAENYRAAVNPAFGTVLVLDPAFQRAYETCDDDGLTKPVGSGPARNFAWEHSISLGVARHWVVDDNIEHFYRLNHNAKLRVLDGTFFYAMETFVDRYANVAMAGPNYDYFANARQRLKPFTINTRLFSCNLIRNDLPMRWRGRYNEDAILSVDMLKAGWCTIQFYAFLQGKAPTQSVKGGNTDAFYALEGTLNKSKMLVRTHPDVARLMWRFGRWHHYIDFSQFKRNVLVKRPDVVTTPGVDEFGMALVRVGGDSAAD